MSTKNLTRIVLVLFILATALSVCSCIGGPIDPVQEFNNITNFASNVMDVTSSFSSGKLSEEELVTEVRGLIHPDSPYKDATLEEIVEELKANEKLAGISSIESVNIVEMPSVDDLASLLRYSEELGGAVYEADIVVSVNGINLTVAVTLFSDDQGMGIYSYSVK